LYEYAPRTLKNLKKMQEQITDTVLMIRPVNFGFNAETAASNAFQTNTESADTQTEALERFDAFVKLLKSRKVNVIVVEDTPNPFTPDSIFPNNWFSTHHSGKVILYPMEAANRRAERRMDIIESLAKKHHVAETIDFTHYEADGKYLEGTGSLILDRIHKVAYACISSRTNLEVLTDWGKTMNYEICSFTSTDANQKPVYHSNVMMCMGDDFAVICLDSISDLDERLRVKQTLEKYKKRIVEISLAQMNFFAGNMLLIKNKLNQKLLVMSETAYKSLNKSQILVLEEYADLVHIELGIIETLGGGSARCMLAEIHLPRRN
jgi:hypothetical protein